MTYLLSCSYVKNFMAELGTMRAQFVPLPFIMPRMPSVLAMCTRPCRGILKASVQTPQNVMMLSMR